MLHSKGLNKSLWTEAVDTAVFILIRVVKSLVKGKTPYQSFYKRDFYIYLKHKKQNWTQKVSLEYLWDILMKLKETESTFQKQIRWKYIEL